MFDNTWQRVDIAPSPWCGHLKHSCLYLYAGSALFPPCCRHLVWKRMGWWCRHIYVTWWPSSVSTSQMKSSQNFGIGESSLQPSGQSKLSSNKIFISQTWASWGYVATTCLYRENRQMFFHRWRNEIVGTNAKTIFFLTLLLYTTKVKACIKSTEVYLTHKRWKGH